MPEKTRAVAALLARGRDVWVWPGRAHVLSRAEELVLATEPMQRLRRLRQIGLAYHALPLCEHTRFSHSLGTAYWAMRMIQALPAAEAARLEAVEDALGPDLSLELTVRLFSLVHDIALLPLGHTLRFQLRLFDGQQTFDGAMQDCLARVAAGCSEQLAGTEEAMLPALRAHLDLVAAVSRVPRLLAGAPPHPPTGTLPPGAIVAALPALTLVYDLVHGVYAADIVDVCLRDMFALGRHWEMPEALLAAGAIFTCRPGEPAWPERAADNGHGLASIHRYGLRAVASGLTRTEVLTDLLHVHRTRFDVAEKGFYASRKCVADAMLDKAIRRLKSAAAPGLDKLLDPARLVRIGDDALLDALAELEAASGCSGRSLTTAIRRGRLHEEVFSRDALSDPGIDARCDALESPEARDRLEQQIAAAVPGVAAGEVVVGVLPRTMQGKPADTLVGWHDNRVLRFDRLAEEIGFPAAARELPEEYRRLRRLAVCLPPQHPQAAGVAAASRALLARPPPPRPNRVRGPIDSMAGLGG